MEPSLLSGKLEVCVATLDHYFPLPSNCTALSALFWSEHKTWSLCFSGLYDTVFDVDTDKERARARGLEPNGFNFDGADSRGVDYALNRQAQSRRAWFTELSNCLLIVPAGSYIFRAISAWFDARCWFHSLCKRVMEQDWSWNRSALDYIELYHSASKFWETNQWCLLSNATIHVLQAPGLGIAVQKHRPPKRGRHSSFQNNGPSSMYVCFLHFNPLYSFLVPILVPLRSLPEPPMWQSFRNMICDNLIGNGRCNSLHEFYWITMQMNPLMYILLCNVVNRSVLSCKWFKKKQMPFLVIVS